MNAIHTKQRPFAELTLLAGLSSFDAFNWEKSKIKKFSNRFVICNEWGKNFEPTQCFPFNDIVTIYAITTLPYYIGFALRLPATDRTHSIKSSEKVEETKTGKREMMNDPNRL